MPRNSYIWEAISLAKHSFPQMTPIDDAIKITSELHDPIAWKRHLHNKKKKDLTESTGMVPAEYTPKVKLGLSSQL